MCTGKVRVQLVLHSLVFVAICCSSVASLSLTCQRCLLPWMLTRRRELPRKTLGVLRRRELPIRRRELPTPLQLALGAPSASRRPRMPSAPPAITLLRSPRRGRRDLPRRQRRELLGPGRTRGALPPNQSHQGADTLRRGESCATRVGTRPSQRERGECCATRAGTRPSQRG